MGISAPPAEGDVADSGVHPLTIVVAFDIGEQLASRGVAMGISALMDEFGFQRVESTRTDWLRERIRTNIGG